MKDARTAAAHRKSQVLEKLWGLWVQAGFLLLFCISLAVGMWSVAVFVAGLACLAIAWRIGSAEMSDKGKSESD